ncbi:HD domain-containing protein [Porcipelethomonas sp.]|uniref:HD domain-containing protein n=1 Tax=Porcipelethomonas sp. TaxID=2981675 RepID=UPI003EF598D1
MNDRLQKQIDFIIEIDKLKSIRRQTLIIDEDRQENDAEHSWHLAMLAFLLEEYSNEKIDVLKTIKMVLVHDIVEIDAGDTYCYDKEGYKTKADREQKAADRIFGILPEDQGKEIMNLWTEFERQDTPESKFASVLDRLQPLLLNYTKGGISWKNHNVKSSQVRERNLCVKDGSEELYDLIMNIIDDAVQKGMLQK